MVTKAHKSMNELHTHTHSGSINIKKDIIKDESVYLNIKADIG